MSPSESNTSTRQHHQDDEIDLQKLWGLLLDNQLLIIIITVLAVLLGAAYAFTATPIYRADALLQVEKKQGGVPGFDELSKMFEQESSAVGEIEILRSRMVLGEAVDTLGITVQLRRDLMPLIGRFTKPGPAAISGPVFASLVDAEADIRVTDFSVPAALEGEEFILQATEQGYQLLFNEQVVLQGIEGEEARSEDGQISLLLERFVLPADDEVILIKQTRLSQISAIRNGLSVSEQGRNSGILSISYTGPSRRGNSAILNAIADAYLMQNIKRMSAEAEKSLEFLERQLPEIRATLEKAEQLLNEFRLKSGSVDLAAETQQVLTRLVALETKENELMFQEKELAALYTREHPAYRTLIQQQQTIESEKEKLSEQVRGLPETQQEVLRLTRDVQVNQEIYVQMLNKSQELRVVRAGTIGNVRIIDRAETAVIPIKPKKPLIMMLSLMLGGMMGVGIVLLRAAFHQGIETPSQLEEVGLPVYATIPLSEEQSRLTKLLEGTLRASFRSAPKSGLLAIEDPTELAIEALRSLRTSLHFVMMDAGNKVLMISGPSPGIGKSFIASNLAVTLAQTGRRVLLIDGDMRKGHLHKSFGAQADRGLSCYLSGLHPLKDVIYKGVTGSVDFIARGPVPPNPAELLMHSRFAEMIEAESADYDLIIIDSPPVLAVTDASIIGQYAGTSLMVARFGVTTIAEFQLALQRFAQNRVVIKGSILNCVENRAGNAYYAYEYK